MARTAGTINAKPTVTGAGTVSTLVDTELSASTDTWPTKIVGQQIRVLNASADLRLVAKFDPTSGIMTTNRDCVGTNGAATNYELWGTAIHGGQALTRLFNDVLRAMKPVTDSQLTEVTGQNHYVLSSQSVNVRTRRDIREVYVRLLDPSNLAPYTIRTLLPGLEWTAHERGGGSDTTTVTIELKHSRTLNTAVETLWVRHATEFTPFSLSLDTGTIDNLYQDWLVWEAILELCRRKTSTTSGDQSRWTTLRSRALEEVSTLRQRHIPREPVQIGLDW